MVKRGRTRGRRGRRRVVRRGRGTIQNGGMIRGRMHPPSNSASPWNNFVVTFMWNPAAPASGKPFETMQDVSTSHIRDRVTSELGLSGGIDMRIRRIDVWTQPQVSNSTRNTVVLAPFDWTSCSATLNWFESWGTSVQPAHCHYIWPKSISNIVLPTGKSCGVVRFDVRDANFAYIIKVHLTWRKSAPDPLKLCPGVVTGLRTQAYREPPPPDEFVLLGEVSAVSPLADVVDALNLRSK